MTYRSRYLWLLFIVFLFTGFSERSDRVLAGEKKDTSLLTIDRIFAAKEFSAKSYGPIQWLKSGNRYTTTESSKAVRGYQDIVLHNPETGDSEILVSAENLVPYGQKSPLRIENYSFSDNEALILIYTNSRRVWRLNSRGDYWVYDITSQELKKVGGDAPASSLMYATFSPNSKKVAYVHEKNIYVQDIASGTTDQLTYAKPNIINGVFDWVYEEEFGLHRGYRWSPDSQYIAYWQLDTEGVGKYYMVDNISGLYQRLRKFNYPKVGTKNSACSIWIVPAKENSRAQKVDIPGDPRNNYIARMDWIGDSNELIIQQFNRLQNTNTVWKANGKAKVIFKETDKAWVDAHDALHWIDGGEKFTWLSERDGWNHLYIISTATGKAKLITPGNYDVIDLVKVDEKHSCCYFYASPDNATQRYLYKASFKGGKAQLISPAKQKGTHSYNISPNGKWAIHSFSNFDTPTVIDLVQLPEHKVIRTLMDNKKVSEKVEALKRNPTEFFKVDIGNDVLLDGWLMKPPEFDSGKKYPLLIYVYGEPAGQTVLDRWSSTRYLWHLMLAQKGYLIMSVDNRGTPAPRGRAWRKIIYRQLGIIAPQDQAAALKAVQKKWSFIDSERVAIWGWSGGGSMSLHAIFRYPELYHTAMSVAPVSNERFYDTIYEERYMGLPRDNVEGYRKGSPITYAHQLKGNLLLVHGTADDNVHYANTEKLIDVLIAANKQFTMMAYPNRTHSIREGKNTRRHLFSLLTGYLQRKMPPGAKSSAN